MFKKYLFSSPLGSFLLETGTHYFNNKEDKFCHGPIGTDQSCPNIYCTLRIESKQIYASLKEKLPVICRCLDF